MLRAGGEADAYCTRCELTLAHTIIAMVGGRPAKVECNTCHGVHRYRSPEGAVRGAPAGPRASRARPATLSFEEVLRSKNPASAQPYSPKSTFRADQLIEHPAFGLGWVSAVRDPGKIEVTFRSDVKVLVHGKA